MAKEVKYSFVAGVALVLGERHLVPGAVEDGAAVGRPDDGDAAAAAEFESGT